VIIGGGTTESSAATLRLVDLLGVPVVTTAAAKGVVPEGHPLLIGAVLARRAAQEWVRDRDLVLAVGTELSETDSVVFPLELTGDLIRVDIDRVCLDGPYPAALAIHSDAGLFADALAGELAAEGALPQADAAEVATLRQAALELAPEERLLAGVLQALRVGMPESARVYADMTQLAYLGGSHFAVSRPRSWLFPAGFGTLGYAVPAAVGGAIADPSVRTFALAGDSGLMYTASELMTATELDLDLGVILWDNEALGQIRDDMVRAAIPPLSVLQQNPDFQKLAEACGFTYCAPDSLSALSEAVADPPGRRTLFHIREAALS
jgi:5-guanidino-2-oxopentanoate decarboxylase